MNGVRWKSEGLGTRQARSVSSHVHQVNWAVNQCLFISKQPTESVPLWWPHLYFRWFGFISFLTHFMNVLVPQSNS